MNGEQATMVAEGQATEADAHAATAGEAEASEQPQFDFEEIKFEVGAIDIGNVAKDEDEQILFRYLRRRSQVVNEIIHLKEQLGAMIRQLENRVKGLDYVYMTQAEDIAKRKIKGKVKSLKTPFGTVGFRTQPGGLVIADEAKLLNAAMMAPEGSAMQGFYETVPTLRKSAVKEHFKSTGELPPHCGVMDSQEKFYVK